MIAQELKRVIIGSNHSEIQVALTEIHAFPVDIAFPLDKFTRLASYFCYTSLQMVSRWVKKSDFSVAFT